MSSSSSNALQMPSGLTFLARSDVLSHLGEELSNALHIIRKIDGLHKTAMKDRTTTVWLKQESVPAIKEYLHPANGSLQGYDRRESRIQTLDQLSTAVFSLIYCSDAEKRCFREYFQRHPAGEEALFADYSAYSAAYKPEGWSHSEMVHRAILHPNVVLADLLKSPYYLLPGQALVIAIYKVMHDKSKQPHLRNRKASDDFFDIWRRMVSARASASAPFSTAGQHPSYHQGVYTARLEASPPPLQRAATHNPTSPYSRVRYGDVTARRGGYGGAQYRGTD